MLSFYDFFNEPNKTNIFSNNKEKELRVLEKKQNSMLIINLTLIFTFPTPNYLF